MSKNTFHQNITLNNREKVLIVGIDSQIGAELKEHLLLNNFEVIGTTRRKDGINKNTLFLDLEDPNYEIFNRPFSVMIICAAITDIAECEKSPEKYKLINVTNTIRLIEKAFEVIDFVVYLSSSAVFDGSNKFFKSDDQTCPITQYGKFKSDVEKYILSHFRYQSCIFRLTKVISKSTPFIERWKKDLKDGKSIVTFSNKYISPVDISDVVKNIQLLISTKASGIFHLGGNEEISYTNYAKRLFKDSRIALSLIVDNNDGNIVNQNTYSFLETNLPKRNTRASYSFEGTDLIVASLLRNIRNGQYIDVGANHPEIQNNTKYFYDLGWSGLAIDGNDEFEVLWNEKRPRDKFITSLVSNDQRSVEFYIYPDRTISSIDPETIGRYSTRFSNEAVAKRKFMTNTLFYLKNVYLDNGEVHLLSIDVEGEDLNCLVGAKLERWRPGVIAIEAKNLSLYTVLDNPIVRYLTEIGYFMIAKTPLDAIFVCPNKEYLSWIPRRLLSK